MPSAPYAIRVFGDPVLKARCPEITDIDAAIVKLANDMIETMYAADGVGLAANQVGIQKRIFVYDDGDGTGARVVLNPVIVETGGTFVWDEGCLSVPKLFYANVRPDRVVLRGLDLDGNDLELEANGFRGRILQHEVDHLNGMLFLERLAPEQRKMAMKALRERDLKASG